MMYIVSWTIDELAGESVGKRLAHKVHQTTQVMIDKISRLFSGTPNLIYPKTLCRESLSPSFTPDYKHNPCGALALPTTLCLNQLMMSIQLLYHDWTLTFEAWRASRCIRIMRTMQRKYTAATNERHVNNMARELATIMLQALGDWQY